jgi:hypothetical protein
MTEDSLSFELTNSVRRIAHAANKGFALAGVPCFAYTFVQGGIPSPLSLPLEASLQC